MISRRSMVVILACAVVSLLLGVSTWLNRIVAHGERVVARPPSPRTAEAIAPTPQAGVSARSLVEPTTAPEPTLPQDVPPTPEATSEALTPTSVQLAIESTLVGQMDPGQFLDIGLALSRLEVSGKAIPMGDESGAVRYPVLGTPDGVSAELWVRHSSTPEYASPILAYHVKLAPSDGYVFEGAMRRGLEVHIQVLNDDHGAIKRFGVLTDSQLSAKTFGIGLGLQGRKIPTGMYFDCYADRPLEWKMLDCSVDNGRPSETESMSTIHGKWPRTDDVGLMNTGLLKQFSKL